MYVPPYLCISPPPSLPRIRNARPPPHTPSLPPSIHPIPLTSQLPLPWIGLHR